MLESRSKPGSAADHVTRHANKYSRTGAMMINAISRQRCWRRVEDCVPVFSERVVLRLELPVSDAVFATCHQTSENISSALIIRQFHCFISAFKRLFSCGSAASAQ
jgi:hypothetical protein